MSFKRTFMFALVVIALIMTLGCEATRSTNHAEPSRHIEPRLQLLTHPDCPATPTMHANLVEAVAILGSDWSITVIDMNALEPSDPRRGYGSPTILINNHDLYDLPQPQPGHNTAPT